MIRPEHFPVEAPPTPAVIKILFDRADGIELLLFPLHVILQSRELSFFAPHLKNHEIKLTEEQINSNSSSSVCFCPNLFSQFAVSSDQDFV
jgi:hypothetical protein